VQTAAKLDDFARLVVVTTRQESQLIFLAAGAAGLAEREAVGLGARGEEGDLDCAVGDRSRLTDQLVEPRPIEGSVAPFVDFEPVCIAGRLAIDEHAVRDIAWNWVERPTIRSGRSSARRSGRRRSASPRRRMTSSPRTTPRGHYLAKRERASAMSSPSVPRATVKGPPTGPGRSP
jgi:hypothetical protein